MNTILSCPQPEDHTGLDLGSSNHSDISGLTSTTTSTIGTSGADGTVDTTGLIDGGVDPVGSFDVLFEGDDLLEALAYASGIYGVSPNGHRTPDVEAEAAGADPPAPPDAPSDGDHSFDDHDGDGGGSSAPRRCEHGQPMLCTDDLTGWWGPPEPGVPQPAWWCPRWCSRTDRDGNEVDPTEWVHRSQPYRIRPTAVGTVTGPDGDQAIGPATITIRAEKHPARPVRFVLGIGINGVEHACTMTVPEAQLLYGFQDQIMDGLTGHRLTA